MARTRNLKPGLFQNELLAELPFEGRLLFAGLPLLADRAGRLEDRPRRIKAALFPFDGDVAVDDLLTDLSERGFISRYLVGEVAVIQITSFLKHQSPHPREPESQLPENPNKNTKPRLFMKGRETQVPSHAGSSGSSGPSGSSGSSGSALPSFGGSSAPPSAAAKPPAPPVAQAVLTFPCVGQVKTWSLTQAQIDRWREAYGVLDVAGECRKALVWVEANPSNRKTATGMPAFLVRWLNKATNQSRQPIAGATAVASRTDVDAVRARLVEEGVLS